MRPSSAFSTPPNPSATGRAAPPSVFASARSHKISLIVPDLSDPNTAVCAHLLAAPIRKLGYHTEIDESGHDPATEDRICQRLTERESDGAIIMTRRAVLDASLLAASSASGPRVLVAFRKVPDFAGDQVVMSAAPALQDMLDALAAAGHRRIALLGGGLEKDPVAEDLAALVRARSGRSGFKLIETPGKEDPLTLWSALPARKRPTALLATTDADAMRCLTRTRATGLEVPRDFSLVTLEGGRLASFAQMSLAGVAMPCERICDQAAMLLLKRINGHPDAPPECVIVPSRFRTGSSLDQAPVD